MTRIRPIIAFLAPVTLAWLLGFTFAFSGFATFVFAMFLLIPSLVVGCVAVVVLTGLWLVTRRREDGRPLARVIGALALGTAVSIVAFFPLVWLDGSLVHAARRPVREMLAVRVIQRSHARHDSRHSRLKLRGIDALLSQSGEIEIYPHATNTSIVFWDSVGIMSGEASVYAEDASAALPEQLDWTNNQRVSGHWWRVWED